MSTAANDTFKFDEQGLLPAVIQDWLDGTVLMLGYMNQEALAKTLATRSVHFWSRSRRSLWEKGETSGHKLHVKELFVDCDRDTVLVKAQPVGPTCHTGERACFFSKLDEQGTIVQEKTQESFGGILEAVLRTIRDRRANPQPGSYTRRSCSKAATTRFSRRSRKKRAKSSSRPRAERKRRSSMKSPICFFIP